MKPGEGNNFGRVFELPEKYPEGYCFNGKQIVQMEMVDWFNPWPGGTISGDPPETWEEVVKILRPFLMKKNYVKPGRQYILITDFGESLIFGHK